jgi:transposase
VKTDRKDAELLARCLLAGSLTRVIVPPPAVEAARELTRAHDACRRDLGAARNRVSKMLLRHGVVYPDASTWTTRHRQWLSRQQFDESASELVFADLVATVDGVTARKMAIMQRLSELATDEQWWPTVSRLRAFRGLDTLSAFTVHLELGADWARFQRPTALSAWLGLTPSLSQSGESSHQGAITKTGSMLARRLLVEAAWRYTREPRIGVTLRNRQQKQPDHILQISNRAQQRLYRVHKKMRARGKPGNVTVVACARELSCFLWAAATAD